MKLMNSHGKDCRNQKFYAPRKKSSTNTQSLPPSKNTSQLQKHTVLLQLTPQPPADGGLVTAIYALQNENRKNQQLTASGPENPPPAILVSRGGCDDKKRSDRQADIPLVGSHTPLAAYRNNPASPAHPGRCGDRSWPQEDS